MDLNDTVVIVNFVIVDVYWNHAAIDSSIQSGLAFSSAHTLGFLHQWHRTGGSNQIKSNQVYLNTTFLKKMTQGCLQDT